MPWSCSMAYVGKTKKSMGTRIKEHQRNYGVEETIKSTVVEHVFSKGNRRIETFLIESKMLFIDFQLYGFHNCMASIV